FWSSGWIDLILSLQSSVQMKLTFERKLPIVFTFVFLVLTTLGFISYQNTLSLQEAITFQARSRQVITLLDDLTEKLLQGEIAVRGFTVTGNGSYVDLYNKTNDQVDKTLDELEDLAAEDPSEAAEFRNLPGLIDQNRKSAAAKIELRKQAGFEGSYQNFRESELSGINGQIYGSIQRLKTRELAILQFREQALSNSMRNTIWILIGGSLAGLISLVVANVFVIVENRKRKRAELDLKEANQNLETRIEERTSELKETNETLRQIASEREELLSKEHAARREAEVASGLRDEFMATVSHELRNPLNSILGWSRLIAAGTLDSEQASKAIRTIIKNAETQNRLIEDLLDVARVVSGKLRLEKADVRIGDVVSYSIDEAKPASADRGVDIHLHSEDGSEDRTVLGDRVRLRQIVGNLLTNSIKFTPPGGRIDVTLRSENGFVDVEVTDTGEGISPEFLPKVFDRFRQDQALMKKSGGLGLGLALVRQLTELHGGTVKAESDGKDKGAKFTVRLPAN
ncbi:MAG TPA: ATP-binding protein, partial [Pyrinomonadaceae bacterium]|nr:ATP-binding protein [Pyrinomonadaceae bacterium]